MLDIKFVRDNFSKVERALETRGATADLAGLQTTDTQRRTLLQEIESLRYHRNKVSDQIAGMKKAGEDASEQMADMRKVSAEMHLVASGKVGTTAGFGCSVLLQSET